MMKKTAVLILGAAVILGACQTTNTINLATYAPVIDTYQVDQAQYNIDLTQCRELGQRAQIAYNAQREKEQEQAFKSALIGAVAGAAIGRVASNNSSSLSSGRATTAGALYGGAIGGAIGADGVDYSRTIAKFGPTRVVDDCMTNRGYEILSIRGFGGG